MRCAYCNFHIVEPRPVPIEAICHRCLLDHNCNDRCTSLEMHEFYTSDLAFRWQIPRFYIVRPVSRRPIAILNRYPHHIIGVSVGVLGRAVTVNWKGSHRGGARR